METRGCECNRHPEATIPAEYHAAPKASNFPKNQSPNERISDTDQCISDNVDLQKFRRKSVGRPRCLVREREGEVELAFDFKGLGSWEKRGRLAAGGQVRLDRVWGGGWGR